MRVRVGIIMGSKSDAAVMEKANTILDELGIGYESVVSSAHRNPERTAAWARGAASRGLQVLIAGAGLSAALPGVIAAHSLLPVIGGHRGDRQRWECRAAGGGHPQPAGQ